LPYLSNLELCMALMMGKRMKKLLNLLGHKEIAKKICKTKI